jgi:hypothetical protein
MLLLLALAAAAAALIVAATGLVTRVVPGLVLGVALLLALAAAA